MTQDHAMTVIYESLIHVGKCLPTNAISPIPTCASMPPPAATEKLYQWDYCVTKCKFNRRAEGADGVGFGVQYPGAKVASSE